MGIAAAVGIRPFLPALLVGVLAAGNVQIDFNGTHYSFQEKWPFLLAMLIAAIVLALAERRFSRAGSDRVALVGGLAIAAVALGALEFGGALAQNHYASWPGWIAGAACALLGLAAIRPLLARVRARLTGADAAALPAYAEGIALLAALLAVLVPPVGVVAVVLLAWLLIAGRRREGRKYAGLRILR